MVLIIYGCILGGALAFSLLSVLEFPQELARALFCFSITGIGSLLGMIAMK